MDAARAHGGRAARPALLLVLLSLSLIVAAGRDDLPPEPWPTELGVAFELYYVGDFLAVQRVCQQVGARSDDPRLRREAAALAAMATMRLPGRDNRIGGRARLAQLADEDTSLLTRPECQLAYGIAQTSLSATGTALYHLNQAAQAFEAAGRTERLAETLLALAEAWARHGEWELTVPEIDVSRPESRAEADRIRTERIRAVRRRAAELPGSETYAGRIDLILAKHLLNSEGGAADGLALLEELAGGSELTTDTAQACLALGEQYEADQRWPDAVRLYARVGAAGLGMLSEQAVERQRAIEQPQLTLEVPGQAEAGERVCVKLAARNLTAIEFEVRRVDLADWLERRQGRFSEPALPITGALVAIRDLDLSDAAEHGWWTSEMLDAPLSFEAPLGAAVVLAQARDAAGNPLVVKRLLLAGDLRSAVFIGDGQAAIWVTRAGGPTAVNNEEKPTARFWMHGSFVPTRPQFEGDAAIFTLPPEARLLRDKRWVCLVQSGEQIALCHGRLDAAGGAPGKPAVALVGGPFDLRVGGELRVFGRLLRGSRNPPAERYSQAIELQLLDALDRASSVATTAVSNAGTFSTCVPITAEMAGRSLSLAVRLDNQAVDHVFSPVNVRVARVDATPLSLTCRLPASLPPAVESVGGQIEAAYPWGTAATHAHLNTRVQAVCLPSAEPRRTALHSHAFGHHPDLNSEGKTDFLQWRSEFDLPEGPTALGLWAEVTGWDGRSKSAAAEVLIGPEPIHLHVRSQITSPRVGEPFHASVNWFDPAARAAGKRPTLAVWRDGVLQRQLRLLPTIVGLRSETWRPTMPGTYELVATLPQAAGEPLTAREVIQVAARDARTVPATSPLHCEARHVRREGERCVHVQLDGKSRQPLLLLLEAGAPLATRALPSLEGPAEFFIPLTDRTAVDMRLVLAASGENGAEIVGVWQVQPGDDEALTVTLQTDSNDPNPGEMVEVNADCLRGGQAATDAILMARLVDVSKSGGVQWTPGEAREDLLLLPGGLQLASSAARSQAYDSNVILETHELSAQMARAFFESPTVWVESRTAGDKPDRFDVLLPDEPGLYRLVVAAQTPDGVFASETLDLDTRQSLNLVADVPQQLMLGDRTVASLALANPRQVPEQVRVSFDGGAGLHADEWRRIDRDTRLEQSEDGSCAALELAPGDAVMLNARVEAVRCGAGTAAFVVETERGLRRASASYNIYADAAEDASPEAITISRKLFLLEEDSTAAEDDADVATGVRQEHQPQWTRLEIAPGERVEPGRLVLVREEFSLAEPLSRIRWRQRLPGNCYTHAKDWDDLRRIGTRRELGLQALAHDVIRLGSDNRHIHEYVIVPVRPGACRFPPPTVYSDDVPVRVDVQQTAARVIVADSN